MGKKLNNRNYLVIQGFMVNELNLKGNELLIYAIIYGFSQEQGQVYNGNLQYLADWTNSTKRGVMKNLASLIEKGYIVKNEKNINGVKFCEYYVSQSSLVVNKVHWGGEQSSPNNIIYNIKENNNISNDILLKESEQKTPKTRKKTEFIPPSFAEVQMYIEEKGYDVDAKVFYEYFTDGNWIDSNGKEVKNWKQKIITWASRSKNKNKNDKPQTVIYERVQ